MTLFDYPDKVGRGGYYIEKHFNEYLVRDRFFGDEIQTFKTIEEAKKWIIQKLNK